MKITGNKNIDTGLILAGIGVGGYLIYSIVKPIVKRITTAVTPPVGQGVIQTPGCNVSAIRQNTIKQQMDVIYSSINGPNFFLYPDEINVILGYDLCELTFGNDYYIQTYGISLYQNISGEWDAQGAYDAAENKLKQNGLGN